MKGDECSDTEVVFKAILLEHYDPEENRFSARLFKGPESSLSRLAIWTKRQIIDGFVDQVHRPPHRSLMGIGNARVGELKRICREYPDKPTKISVIEDPLDGTQSGGIINPAHAVIPQKLSEGLARHLPQKIEVEWGSIEELLRNSELPAPPVASKERGCLLMPISFFRKGQLPL